eukprot:6953199-Pyramimonas_sp.AAC.1
MSNAPGSWGRPGVRRGFRRGSGGGREGVRSTSSARLSYPSHCHAYPSHCHAYPSHCHALTCCRCRASPLPGTPATWWARR